MAWISAMGSVTGKLNRELGAVSLISFSVCFGPSTFTLGLQENIRIAAARGKSSK
jgi:hypothetical protein